MNDLIIDEFPTFNIRMLYIGHFMYNSIKYR